METSDQNPDDVPKRRSSSSSKIEQLDVPTATENDEISGYRLIDMHPMSNVIYLLHCAQCETPTLSLGDRITKKQGLASLLYVRCSKCDFVTSQTCQTSPTKHLYDINQRMVYTMHVLGHGHAGIEKFNHLMNIPKPMTQNNYDKVGSRIIKVVKNVAEYTMTEAAAEIKQNKGNRENEIIGCWGFVRRNLAKTRLPI